MTVCPLRPANVLRIAVLAIGATLLQGAMARTAAASCGDWLAGHETVAADANAVAANTTHATIARNDFASNLGLTSSGAELPTHACNGPACHKLPTMPDAPLSPVTSRVIVSQWLLGASLAKLLCLPVAGRVFAEHAGVLQPAEQDRIERPPRSC